MTCVQVRVVACRSSFVLAQAQSEVIVSLLEAAGNAAQRMKSGSP